MKNKNIKEHLRRGKEFLNDNKPKDALAKFRVVIEEEPGCHEAYFQTALACRYLGMIEEAFAVISEANKLDPGNNDYLELTGILCNRLKDYRAAYEHLSAIGVDNIETSETLNILARCAEHTLDSETQLYALKKSLILQPDQQEVKEKLETLRIGGDSPSHNGRKKIAVFTSNDYFLRDIISRLKEKYEVRQFKGSSLSELSSLMRWSDLSWFEWCDNLAVQASKLPKYSKTICRLHRYEIFTDMPGMVNWKNIDHLVCVLDIFGELAKEKLKLDIPVSIIRNGVNFSKYVLPTDKKYGKKVAYVGYLKKSKGPELLLQCFKKIYDYDPEYSFHIAGKHVDQEVEIYCDHMIKEMVIPVSYEGWVEDIPSWFEDKDYIICSSISESFMYAIVEGIACGLMPLVHNWPGSDQIYPKESIFLTTDECLERVKRYEKCDKYKKAIELRDHMKSRFSLEKQISEIEELLEQYL
ncbi:glycosyltransferase [candidate division KSB1 bacterium]|nr:glycosyltransferase [candidate division KSB1 bacterium]